MPNLAARAVGELRRHWARYFFASLVLTLAFVTAATALARPDEPRRYEALVVAIGPDSVPNAARRVFESEAFARTILAETGTTLSADVLISEILTLRTTPGSTTLAIESASPDSDLSETLAEAAGDSMARSLEDLGFFTRALEPTPIPEVRRISSPNLVLSVVASLLAVVGWVVTAARTRPGVGPDHPDTTAGQNRARAYSGDPEPDAPTEDELFIRVYREALMTAADSEPPRARVEDANETPALETQPEAALPAVWEPDDTRVPSWPPPTEQGTTDLAVKLRIAMLLEKSFGDKYPRVRRDTTFDGTGEEAQAPETAMPNGTTEMTPGEADELIANILGIGPVYGTRLAELGVTTCEQLANSDPEVIADGTRTQTVTAEDWIRQAQALVESDD